MEEFSPSNEVPKVEPATQEMESAENLDDTQEQEMSTEDLADHANDKVDVLINLLIKKQIISEEEYDAAYSSFFQDDSQSE